MKPITALSVASEIYPLIKTGGLADVTGALPGALAPHQVTLLSLIPGYPAVLKAIDKAEPVHHFAFSREDALLLGPETRGLPDPVLESVPWRVRIPISDKVRSLNLSTAAGILLIQAMARTGLLDEAGHQ